MEIIFQLTAIRPDSNGKEIPALFNYFKNQYPLLPGSSVRNCKDFERLYNTNRVIENDLCENKFSYLKNESMQNTKKTPVINTNYCQISSKN